MDISIVRVIWVPKSNTRTSRNEFGFLNLVPEIVTRTIGFKYFGILNFIPEIVIRNIGFEHFGLSSGNSGSRDCSHPRHSSLVSVRFGFRDLVKKTHP